MLYFYNDHKWDSLIVDHTSTVFTAERGYYQTTKVRGMPGHTYDLFVRIGDSTFQASVYMPCVTNLDSAAIKMDPVVYV